MIDSLLYKKLQHHLKGSLNLPYLENGTYYQIVAHLERKLELSSLEKDGGADNTHNDSSIANDIQKYTEQINRMPLL